MAHLHGGLVGADRQLVAQLGLWAGPLVAVHGCLHRALGIPYNVLSEFQESGILFVLREQSRGARHFYDLTSEVTYPHLGQTLFV